MEEYGLTPQAWEMIPQAQKASSKFHFDRWDNKAVFMVA